MSLELTEKICFICTKNQASYTCPRCNKAYCSSDCYRNLEKHSECSESFYRDQVLTELKNLNLDDLESKNKMANILKNEAKKMAEEDNLLSDDSDSDLNETKKENSSPKEEDLIKEYLNEILNWRPWWRSEDYKTPILITEIDQNIDLNFLELNPKLVANSSNLNIQNSSPYLYNEIVKMFYIYQMCIYVYQLTLDDFKEKKDEKIDLILLEEICNNFLEIEHVLNKRVAKDLNIRQEFELIISVLLEEQSYFLKVYTNKKFFLNLIDELEYAQMKIDMRSYKNRPIYHLIHFTLKLEEDVQSRVKIIRNEDTLKSSEKFESKFTKRDFKLYLKKLEFYFKWLEVNKSNYINFKMCDYFKSELDLVKTSFTSEMEQFRKEKELIDQNLNKIRHNQKLIEEI
ncbi:unnamed protein product [Brachionus calyciflorus]|uniref:HIT-type domain-containing protein n=1 Tax=Brachionus calyciflorus TaxID=104777 RepID=A0A813Z9S4_9BILA|nr:unnamed protein product [Brachionus calyciflorus]